MLVNESIEDVLKPKSQTEIENVFDDLFKIIKIKELCKKYKSNNLLSLVFVDNEIIRTYYFKDENILTKEFLDWIYSIYKSNMTAKFYIIAINLNNNSSNYMYTSNDIIFSSDIIKIAMFVLNNSIFGHSKINITFFENNK